MQRVKFIDAFEKYSNFTCYFILLYVDQKPAHAWTPYSIRSLALGLLCSQGILLEFGSYIYMYILAGLCDMLLITCYAAYRTGPEKLKFQK